MLDSKSEKLLEELISLKEYGIKKCGNEIEMLVKEGYVNGTCVSTMSDRLPVYLIQGITQKGKSYREQQNLENKEKKDQKIREWLIPIITAIIGAVVGYLLK